MINIPMTIAYFAIAFLSICISSYIIGRRNVSMWEDDTVMLVCLCLVWPGVLFAATLAGIGLALSAIGEWFYHRGRKSKPDA